MAFVEFHDVKKVYQMGQVRIEALRDVNFEVEKGEFCVVVGASGAGKTTILNILGGMDTLSEGSVWLDGKEISSYNKRQLTEYRRFDIGFVFQFYNLVQNLTALENVELAAQICKDPLPAASVLEAVGLEERIQHRQGGTQAFAGHLPQQRGDGHCHHPQPGNHCDGRPHYYRPQRYGGQRREEYKDYPGRADRMVKNPETEQEVERWALR